MYVDVYVQEGLRGARVPLGPTLLDPVAIGSVATWAGSYHVLAMGRHYDDYVMTSRVLMLPYIAGFPRAHPYEKLTGKIRDAGVTGNIGEAIAAIIARRFAGAAIADIAHIQARTPFRRRRAPDYLMRLGPVMPGALGAVIPPLARVPVPEWWPVESKARTTPRGCSLARTDALDQLATYWSILAGTQPQVVGFGMIVTFAYKSPREVCVSVILPSNQNRLVREFRNGVEGDIDLNAVRRWLNAC